MAYLVLKIAHVVAAMLFVGAGLASAFYKLAADRSRNLEAIAFAHRAVVLADWLFTVPSVVALPVTGLWMAHLVGLPWLEGWVARGIACYALATLFWIPAAVLQVKMRDAAQRALSSGRELPPEHRRWTRIWLALGVPALAATFAAIHVMITKGADLGD